MMTYFSSALLLIIALIGIGTGIILITAGIGETLISLSEGDLGGFGFGLAEIVFGCLMIKVLVKFFSY